MVTWILSELRPYSGSLQDPASELCQSSHFEYELVSLQSHWFKNSFLKYWEKKLLLSLDRSANFSSR